MNDIKIYDNSALVGMRKACRLAKLVLDYVSSYITDNVTTNELNDVCHNFIIENGAVPAPLNYNGFPKSICTSVNNVVCHGIPSDTKLKNGDIINIDITVILDGWYGDTSKTFLVGECTNLAKRLVKAAKCALDVGISAVKPYGYFGDIGKAIQRYIDTCGFSIVRDYCGHGIGDMFHGKPTILHHDNNEKGQQIKPGMFFTIEPMINAGGYKTKVLKDGWTAVTADKSLSAQFEHTIAVTDNGVEVLTA
ncbi:MAG: type I methionyl aminopeptidase [Alphaproteobacteria bacterium]|nr:type I methionyl aminopeptidase [Alphaproteobacteria bacterium]